LRRLQTDHVEFYFNHAVNDISRLQNDEWFEFTETAKAQGKIQFTGISGHAGRLVDTLDYAVDNKLIDVMLVGYNFGQDPKFYESITRSFDFVATQPDLPRVLEKAKSRGIGVIAMKTLMGARLNDLRRYEDAGNTFAQAAFRWTLGNPNVDALIVSMTTAEQIDEYLGASGAERLASGDLELLREYAAINGASYCKHACNACEGSCPWGVDIANVLRTRMYATDYQDLAFARSEYQSIEANAEACLGCDGQPCQSACPHELPIDQLCAPTHRMLA
ncbi:MAG: aldo/keto reductase, partial [Pseudomonadales bacterium]